MLVTTIAHATDNDYLSQRMREAFAFLRETDLEELACGRYAIDGDDVYANVMEYETTPASEKSMEAHLNYYDVQYIVTGCEFLEYAQVEGLSVVQPYDAASDYALYDAPEGATRVKMSPGEFVVVAPEDAHKPGCAIDDIPAHVKKVVVKVRK